MANTRNVTHSLSDPARFALRHEFRPDQTRPKCCGFHYGMGLGNLQLFAQCHHVLGPCNYLITAYLYTETQKNTQSLAHHLPCPLSSICPFRSSGVTLVSALIIWGM